MSELPHPLLAKAVEAFGTEPEKDSPDGVIASSTSYRLWKIRASQWRGGVWLDQTLGVHWLIVGRLSKGGHGDREDFYEVVDRAQHTGEAQRWLPTDEDIRLLKAETASRITLSWELGIQDTVSKALDEIHDGGTTAFELSHPLPDRVALHERDLAKVTLSVEPVREDGYDADEFLVEVAPSSRWSASNLAWQATLRILISIEPPEQNWDVDRNVYSNIGEPGHWRGRAAALRQMVADGQLGESVPGEYAHYAHRRHLAGSTVEGSGVRGLCGVFFVPQQDHAQLPTCPRCSAEFSGLPR